MIKNIQFLSIGHRLSKQLLSEHQYGYNYLENGTADIEQAFNDYYYISSIEAGGYSIERVSMESLDTIRGPDFVVGTKNNKGQLEKADIAFIYDDLDIHDDIIGEKRDAYQARVLFDDGLALENAGASAEILKNALTLLMMKDNFSAFIQDTQPEMIIGLHHKITDSFPQISQTITDLGFTEDRRDIGKDQIVRFHKGTAFYNEG